MAPGTILIEAPTHLVHEDEDPVHDISPPERQVTHVVWPQIIRKLGAAALLPKATGASRVREYARRMERVRQARQTLQASTARQRRQPV